MSDSRSVWLVIREVDYEGSEILSVHSTKERADAAVAGAPDSERWYGELTVSEWPVDHAE